MTQTLWVVLRLGRSTKPACQRRQLTTLTKWRIRSEWYMQRHLILMDARMNDPAHCNDYPSAQPKYDSPYALISRSPPLRQTCSLHFHSPVLPFFAHNAWKCLFLRPRWKPTWLRYSHVHFKTQLYILFVQQFLHSHGAATRLSHPSRLTFMMPIIRTPLASTSGVSRRSGLSWHVVTAVL